MHAYVCAVPVFRHESCEPHYTIPHGVVRTLTYHSAQKSHLASVLVNQFSALSSEI